MIDKLFAVCRVYRETQFEDIHTIDSCYVNRTDAEKYLMKYYAHNPDFYIDEITDPEAIILLCESEDIES